MPGVIFSVGVSDRGDSPHLHDSTMETNEAKDEKVGEYDNTSLGKTMLVITPDYFQVGFMVVVLNLLVVCYHTRPLLLMQCIPYTIHTYWHRAGTSDSANDHNSSRLFGRQGRFHYVVR